VETTLAGGGGLRGGGKMAAPSEELNCEDFSEFQVRTRGVGLAVGALGRTAAQGRSRCRVPLSAGARFRARGSGEAAPFRILPPPPS